MKEITGYRIESESGGFGYVVRELTAGDQPGWPVAVCFTLWGARRTVRRLLARKRVTENYPIGG